MIDYISITKHDCKDSLYLGNCKLQSTYESGWQNYLLEGCECLEVKYNPYMNALTIEGSLPYFLQGYNFKFSRAETAQALNIIDSMLGGAELGGAIVNQFEFGAIMDVELKPKEYIARHYAGANFKKAMNERYAGKFALWKGAGEDLKLYDAGANIKAKLSLKRRLMMEEEAGWNPDCNYIKFEVRYTKPALINRNKHLLLNELQQDSFQDMLNENLIDQYHLLKPARELIMPTDKKNFTSLDAVIFTLAESCMNAQGLPLQDAKKRIYKTIRDADCLSKSDKDARRRQISKAFGKLEEAPESKWDLTSKMKDALESENKPQ